MGKRLGTRLAVALAVVAIGCGSQNVPSGAPNGGAPASVEIVPGAVLLTKSGETKQLAAIVRDAAGAEVKGAPSLTWTSSDQSVVSVAANGMVTVNAAVGSATVVAKAGAFESPPATITVAQPVSGAILITDQQVVEGPTFVDAEPTAPNAQYDVVLRGVPTLTLGSIVINTEAKVVAGRVVSTDATGGDTRARLELVPPKALFSRLLYRDTIHIDDDTVALDEAVTEFYDVAKTDAGYTLTPKAGASGRAGGPTLASWAAPGTTGVGRSARGATGTQAAGPFECESESPLSEDAGLPFELGVTPPVSISFDGEVTREITEQGSTVRLSATPTVTFEMSLEVKVAFEFKLTCKMYVHYMRFPAPLGAVGLIAGGRADYGVGFEIGGSVTLASFKAGASFEYAPNVTAVVTCPSNGGCSFSRDDERTTTEFEPIWDVPSLGNFRLEPALQLFVFVELSGGVTLFDSLMYDFLEAKAGVELAASLSSEAFQIDDTDDEEGKSNYELALKAEVGPAHEFESFLEHLGLDEVVPLSIEASVPIGKSPEGKMTSKEKEYAAGQHVILHVKLDPAWTLFPGSFGVYNVRKVLILKRDDVDPTRSKTLAELPGSPGKTEFDFDFVTEDAFNADELYAFVLTEVLPLAHPYLEVAQATVPIKFTFDRDLEGWSAFGRGPRSSTKEWGTVEWRAEDGGCVRISGEDGQDGKGAGRLNSRIALDITLPDDATRLTFKASADSGHLDGADSLLKVAFRQVDGATVLLSRSYANASDELQWENESIDISAFAGQTVQISFEQFDNGGAGHEHIYLDDIEIETAD